MLKKKQMAAISNHFKLLILIYIHLYSKCSNNEKHILHIIYIRMEFNLSDLLSFHGFAVALKLIYKLGTIYVLVSDAYLL